jgi:hypothetical protein
MVEVIRFHCAFQVAIHLVGQGGIAEPPTPAIARADMDAPLPGKTTRGTRETEQQGGENPVGQGPLAAVEERIGEIIAGAVAVSTAEAFTSWPLVIIAPGSDGVALTPGTLQRTIFPAQAVDISVAGLGIEELMQMRENRHD